MQLRSSDTEAIKRSMMVHLNRVSQKQKSDGEKLRLNARLYVDRISVAICNCTREWRSD
jgi:hypothetical protein